MDKIIINQSPGSKRIRLSREELLAGKCFPDEPKETDERFKSPDRVIERAPMLEIEESDSETKMRLKQVTRELHELRERYHSEIMQWKEYQSRVEQWKTQVFDVVNRLKAALKEKSNQA